MIRTELHRGDCLELLKLIPTASVDLVVTDPPYQIDNTKGGGSIKKKMEAVNRDLLNSNLTGGFDLRILDELMRVLKVPNLYIWCNGKQIPMYLDYFVKGRGLNFDILVWVKTNAMPAYNNKYLTDKEYCLYFRGGGTANLLTMSTQGLHFSSQSTLRIRGCTDIPQSNRSISFRH